MTTRKNYAAGRARSTFKWAFCLALLLSYLASYFAFSFTARAEDNIAPEIKDKLYARIEEVHKALKAQDYEILIRMLPQDFTEAVAREAYSNAADLLAYFVKKLGEQLAAYPKSSFTLDAQNVRFGQAASLGTMAKKLQSYAMIPVTIVTQRGTLDSTVLGLYEKGDWYFIYGGPRVFQNPVFLKIYPELQELRFPADHFRAHKKNS